MTPESAPPLEQTVRDLFAALDAMELDRIDEFVADNIEAIDEFNRSWLRGSEAMKEYMGRLEGTVSEVHSELTDISEQAWGETALLTFVLDQTYTVDGQRATVSAPSSIVARLEGNHWQLVLFHSVPLPAQD